MTKKDKVEMNNLRDRNNELESAHEIIHLRNCNLISENEKLRRMFNLLVNGLTNAAIGKTSDSFKDVNYSELDKIKFDAITVLIEFGKLQVTVNKEV